LAMSVVAEHGDVYEPVACPACGSLHLINQRTGKMLSDREGATCPTLRKS
jgi:hypothetical protein